MLFDDIFNDKFQCKVREHAAYCYGIDKKTIHKDFGEYETGLMAFSG